VDDEGRRAFLLSFDKGEKYMPQSGINLIRSYHNWGPLFDFGDLSIADDCHANSNSFAHFPHTYNREGSNKIVSSQ
jgi:hypothetical protein